MSIANDRTPELWRTFMPRRKEIKNTLSTELFCLQEYHNPNYFSDFDPSNEFVKWAAAEVSTFAEIPKDMKPLTLAGGLYAVFLHLGPASEGAKSYHYIFGTWLPQSGYVLDNRMHFNLLGEKYKNNAPDSEEELWIPIRKKGSINKAG
jgi:AraC family transcriptional regulator